METKSRQLIIDTLQPTMKKVHEQKDDLVAMQRSLINVQNQIRELEFVVFKKNQKLPVFEEIDERITQIEKTRAESEAAIWWEIEAQKKINRD